MALKHDRTGLYLMAKDSNIFFYNLSTETMTYVGLLGPLDPNGYFSLACDNQGNLYSHKRFGSEVVKYDPTTNSSNVIASIDTFHISTEVNYIDPYIYLSGPLYFPDGDPWIFRIKDGKIETLANAPASSSGMHALNVVIPYKESDTSSLKVYSSDSVWGRVFIYIDTNGDGYLDTEKLFKDAIWKVKPYQDVIFGFGILRDGSLIADYRPISYQATVGIYKIKDLNNDHDAEDSDEFTKITTWYSDEGTYLDYIVKP
jgi:hypothetical protein